MLSYTAHAQVGGKLAQIGSRLIDGAARKMADDFFAKFTQVVGQPAEPVAETEVVSAPGTVEPAQPTVAAETAGAGASAGAATPPAEPAKPEPPVFLSSETAAVPPPSPTPTRGPTVAPGAPTSVERSRGLQPMVWIPLIIVVVAILLWAFT